MMTGMKVLRCVLAAGLFLVPVLGSGPSPASAADFDHNGYADLAIGVSWEPVNNQPCAGAVNVRSGATSGITPLDKQLWIQNDLSPHYSWPGDYFGRELAAGDFDGDGAADLAVGTPFRDAGGFNTGAVEILHGGSWGLRHRLGPDEFWSQNVPGMEDGPEMGDRFGSALVAIPQPPPSIPPPPSPPLQKIYLLLTANNDWSWKNLSNLRHKEGIPC